MTTELEEKVKDLIDIVYCCEQITSKINWKEQEIAQLEKERSSLIGQKQALNQELGQVFKGYDAFLIQDRRGRTFACGSRKNLNNDELALGLSLVLPSMPNPNGFNNDGVDKNSPPVSEPSEPQSELNEP